MLLKIGQKPSCGVRGVHLQNQSLLGKLGQSELGWPRWAELGDIVWLCTHPNLISNYNLHVLRVRPGGR